jgi:hypothetical protein
MQVQVTLILESAQDRDKLNAILAICDGNVKAAKSLLIAGKGKRANLPSTGAMVEELSAHELKLLDIAERKAHEQGETPLADSLGMNRSEIIRELVRAQQGELTIPQIGSLLYASYPEVDRKRWMQSAHTMATERQPNYCLRKDSQGKVTLIR